MTRLRMRSLGTRQPRGSTGVVRRGPWSTLRSCSRACQVGVSSAGSRTTRPAFVLVEALREQRSGCPARHSARFHRAEATALRGVHLAFVPSTYEAAEPPSSSLATTERPCSSCSPRTATRALMKALVMEAPCPATLRYGTSGCPSLGMSWESTPNDEALARRPAGRHNGTDQEQRDGSRQGGWV